MKKTLITVLATVLVCSAAFGATYAWLTDKTATVTNTFTYGNIDIELAESENLDLKMMPGKTITKDPKVTVKANSEKCWLFVKIDQSSNYSTFLAAYVVASGWTELTGNAGVYYREVAQSSNAQEFPVLLNNQVKVLDDVTQTQFGTLTEATLPTLSFTAYAVQQEGFTTAADAWVEAAKLG